MLAHKLRQHVTHAMPRYLTGLQALVVNPSYTRDSTGVKREATLMEEIFRQSSLLSITAERSDGRDAEYGQHLVLRVGLRGSADRGVAGRRKVGLVSHLDTVYPEATLLRDDHKWKLVASSAEADALQTTGELPLSDAALRDLKMRLASGVGPIAYGPGTMDIKGGSVIALATLEALASTCPEVFKQLDLVVVFNAAEEEMTPCFGRLLRRELEGAAACLVFETGKYEPAEKKWTVVQARKGRAVWKISAEGVQAHAGNAHHLGDNAIAKLARAVIGIESKTDYQQNLTFNVGQMQGGDTANTVPGSASALVEMRCDDKQRFDVAQAETVQYWTSMGLQAELLVSVAPWDQNSGTDSLIVAYSAAAESQGQVVTVEHRGGLSDGNWCWGICPTVDGLGMVGWDAHCSITPAPESAALGTMADRVVLNVLGLLTFLSVDDGGMQLAKEALRRVEGDD